MEKHPRKSEKVEPERQPVEPEMEKGLNEDESSRNPATEPPKEKRIDNL